MADDSSYLVRVTHKGSRAVTDLDRSGRWLPGDSTSSSKYLAEMIQREFVSYMKYEYSPGDGHPGYRFAQEWAKNVGCTVETNPPPPLPEGAIA